MSGYRDFFFLLDYSSESWFFLLALVSKSPRESQSIILSKRIELQGVPGYQRPSSFVCSPLAAYRGQSA